MSYTPAVLITRMLTLAKGNSTTGSADRALALQFLQEAAERVCADAGVRIPAAATVTLTAGTSVYTLGSSPFPTDMVEIHSIRLTDSAVTGQPLDAITWRELDDLRAGTQANGTPYGYAVDWPQFVLVPAPGSGASLALSYSQSAPTLADDSTAITFIPSAYVMGCLYQFAMSEFMRFKKQPEADQYLSNYLNDTSVGLKGLRRFKARSGGRQLGGEPRYQPRIANPSQDLGY